MKLRCFVAFAALMIAAQGIRASEIFELQADGLAAGDNRVELFGRLQNEEGNYEGALVGTNCFLRCLSDLPATGTTGLALMALAGLGLGAFFLMRRG